MAAIAAASALLLSGCASGSSADSSSTPTTVSQAEIDKAMETPTTLTFWSWVPIQPEIDLFEAKYPNITVNLVNVGNGDAEFDKIRTALKAGTGAPDVAQMGYQDMPSFRVTDSLLDLTPYGAADLADQYVPWVWNQVSSDSGVFGIPQDSGPMGLLYRSDIYAQAGVTPPTSYDEYTAAAQTIKEKTGSYISNFPSGEPGTILSLLWQAGVKPFTYDGGQNVKIDLTSPEATEVVDYWNNLVKNDLVSVDAEWTDQWYQGLAQGKYASWLTAAWAPLFLEGTAPDTAGNWTATTLPQWKDGDNVSANLGGSANVVLKSTENPIAAYEFAKWINNDPSSTIMLANDQSLFPTTNATLEDPAFVDTTSDFFGGQKVNQLFAEISPTVDTDFDWLPFMSFVGSSFTDTLGKAIADRTDLETGVAAWQQELVDYATQQGFTVEE
ncbi:ABC transporter substrate-binding protein [Compostimonas suwonensis]|uniref:ABC transporter substrate-binding protein n=1 Tax=Compostimonas suwonensis TaxID=1048394 RepID=UPI001FE594C6|nr:sugar ABC transporter substrate-binding protein [Compostimonas suwonensis]